MPIDINTVNKTIVDISAEKPTSILLLLSLYLIKLVAKKLIL